MRGRFLPLPLLLLPIAPAVAQDAPGTATRKICLARLHPPAARHVQAPAEDRRRAARACDRERRPAGCLVGRIRSGFHRGARGGYFALALAIAATHGALLPLHAQGRSAEDTGTIDGYRLTMPTLRKVLPALYAEGADTCKRQEGRDPHTLSIAKMARTLERCGPVLEALERAAVTPREAAIAFASLLRTGQQVAMRGGKAATLPPGVLRDNALLLERNDSEIRQLTKTGAPP